MNQPIGSHEPSPEFRAHLEWQIESALRREDRFAAPAVAGMGRLRAAIVVLAALAAGGIAVAASGQVQDARQRDALIEAVRSEESLLRVRVALAEADYQDARRRFETGTVARETLLAAEQQLGAMQMALKRVVIDMEEIQATSAAPRNELQAPLVGQRDFVKDRLALELETAQRALVAAERATDEAVRRVRVGSAAKAAQLQAEQELAEARLRLQMLQANLDLRLRSLRGEIGVDAVASTARRTELTLRSERARRVFEITRQRVEEVKRLVANGLATQLELKRAEVELLELEVELQRMRRELETLPPVKP